MAHIWVRDADREWAVLRLDRGAIALDRHPPCRAIPSPESPGHESRNGRPHIVLLRPDARGDSPGAPGRSWALVTDGKVDVRVNGLPVWTGIRALRDRDEIRVAGMDTVFFSTETLARVEPMPETEQPVRCARCRTGIRPGDTAVRCPGCGVWHCQTHERPCWTYAETCAVCPTPTALDGGYRWTPVDG